MESFYGGKQGASFTIKETFNSVEEMEIAFRGGDTYKKVAYGEHVLIAGDELNEEYGNVYRRGYDGAELVGNFRGPQGTPFKFQGTYDATKTYYNNNKQIDLVYYDSRTFIRIGDADSIVGVLPLDERYWSMFLETKPGTTWHNGGTITGTNYFGEIFPNSGVSYANQNDYYFNTNTTSIYIAMNEGTPDIVMWRYVMTLANEVNTDDTLTVQGAAADAAKVGQEIEALNLSLSNKAKSEDLTEHINNNLIHLTEEDREKLNNIDAGELEQHLLTIENLNNIKPDAYTCYYAHDDNVVMNVPSGYENKPFNLVVYKTSETYRVQEYTSEKGKKFIRYCTHDLTDDNMIDDHGFDWGLNGRDLCKDKTYYGCLKDAAGNSFIIYSDTLLEVVDYGTSGYYINSTNVYHLDNATKTYLKYITDDYRHPEQLLVRTFSGNQWFNMLLYYSSQESIGVYNVDYGTASDIINAGTGWSEWQDMGATSGNIYIDSDESSDTIDGDITATAAKYVSYDNTVSGLEADTVQDAIDRVSSVVGTTYEEATETEPGLMSSEDKVKLNNVEAGANNYTHPTSDVTPGTYKSVTVDEEGHVTSGTNPTTLDGYGITDAEAKGTASSAVSAHDTSTSAHNDIRELITGLTARLNTLANSDDTTLDQMKEVVDYIKANRELIESITTTKVNVSDIVDNLTTNVSNKPLSAAQGVAIKSLIDTLQTEVNAKAKASDLTSHTDNKSNPHSVTKSQVGLGNVENKSSETIRGELTKANVTNALGYTPPTTDTKYTHPTTSGNKHIPSGGSSGQILKWSADGTAVWGNESGSAISGVKGNAESSYRTGNVNITPTNIGLGNVNNTSDVNKPVSTAQQTAIDNALSTAKSYADTAIGNLGLNGFKTHRCEVGYGGSNYILSNVGSAYNIFISKMALIILQIGQVVNVYSVYNTGSTFMVAPVILNQSANHGTVIVNSSKQIYINNSNTSSNLRCFVLYV